jgi:protein TonB
MSWIQTDQFLMRTEVRNKLGGESRRMRFAVGLLVLALHGALLYALWRVRPDTMPDQPVPVFVRLLETPPPPIVKTPAVKAATPMAHPVSQKQASSMASGLPVLSNEAPGVAPMETLAPSPMAISGPEVGEPSARLPVSAAIGLAPDLSLTCPVRTAPMYPRLARKMGETGKVSLRVELDVTGRLISMEVAHSSGFPRLDEAALAAVKSWRCNPAMRDGQSVRVVSMESFDFKLQPEGY